MKELLQLLETAPASDRRIMAAAMVSSAVLLTLAATVQLLALWPPKKAGVVSMAITSCRKSSLE
jgi:hypothetical protein